MIPHLRILVGPGDRLGPLVTLLTGLREDRMGPDAPLAIRALRDVEGLLQRQGPVGLVLLDADELDVEDLGLVRRFFQRHPGWELILTGDDDRSRPARRLSALPRSRWLPWPLDVDQLTAMLVRPSGLARASGLALPSGLAPRPGLAASAGPAAATSESVVSEQAASGPGASGPGASGAGDSDAVDPGAVEEPATGSGPIPERDPEPTAEQALTVGPELGDSLRAVLGSGVLESGVPGEESGETSLEEDLASIEAILRGETPEGTAPEPDEPDWDDLEGDGESPRGLELTREEIEAFLDPLEGDEAYTPENSTADAPPHESTADRPPPWFKAQVADLADLAQALDLSARAMREAREEDGAVTLENVVHRHEGDVLRLVQFARTLGYLAAPPDRGAQRIALGTLLEEQLAGLAGAEDDSPRFLFRDEQEAWVRSDKTLLVAAFDALLHVAAACSSARDVVRVAVEPDEHSGVVEMQLSFPGQALRGLSPAQVLAPYGLRDVLPHIGANALAAASRILEGQGGRLALGSDGPGDRMLFRVRLPLAADADSLRPAPGEPRQSGASATGELG